jgi:hypothetical protein
LQPYDGHLHGVDGSHRWSGGPADPKARLGWLAVMREHVFLHRWPPVEDEVRLLAQPVRVPKLPPRG